MKKSEELEYDPVRFTVYCLEIHREDKSLTGPEIIALFQKHNVFDFIEECGDTLHCLAKQTIIDDIDTYIKNHE